MRGRVTKAMGIAGELKTANPHPVDEVHDLVRLGES